MPRRSRPGPPFARFFARVVLAALGLLLAFGVPRPVWAEDAAAGLVPRDVSVMVQPNAARLQPAPPDFERIDHDWLLLEEPASIHDRSEALLKAADGFRTRLSQDFGQPPLEKVIVRIAREPDQMAELAPAGAPPFTYAAGMAYPSLRVILLTLKVPDTWDAPDLHEILGHELAHMALADAVASHHVPLWFDEGLAIHESGELPYARMKTLWDATMSGRLLPLEYLDQRFPSDRYEVNEAYAEAADFVRFLMRDADRARFVSMLQRVRAGVPFDRTLEDAYGSDTRKLEYEWHGELSRRYGIIPLLTGGGLIWVLIAGLTAAAWIKRRRKARAKLEEWAREEAEMDALVAARRAATASTPPPEDDMPARPPSIPVVEHDGRWHTLH